MQCTIGYNQIKGVSVMETINIHLNEEDASVIKEYVEAMYHHQKESKAISFEEMMKELNRE